MATTVNAYVNFDGRCEEAFNFYKSIFGGEFDFLGRYKDMPSGEGEHPAGYDGDKIMHVSLPISNETKLMGSDAGGDWAKWLNKGNNMSISINVEDTKEADRIFYSLANDGKITVPLEKAFWGDYFGMLEDKFGINWMMSCRVPQTK